MAWNPLLFLIFVGCIPLILATCGQPSSCPTGTLYVSENDAPSKGSIPMCSTTPQGQQHCSSVSQQLWKTCKVNGWGPDQTVATEYPQEDTCCWCLCTCSCFKYGTKVYAFQNDTEGFTSIESLTQGDKVQVLDNSPGIKPYKWSFKELIYSSGASPGTTITVIVITYGDGSKQLVSTPENLFLVKDKSQIVLTRADYLNPAIHKLLDSKGEPVDIVSVNEGATTEGVWHVATADADLKVQAHLLNVEGIIAADFFLSLTDVDTVSDKWNFPINNKFPRVGSLAHKTKNPTNKHTARTLPSIHKITYFDANAFSSHEPPARAKTFIPAWMGNTQYDLIPLSNTKRGYINSIIAVYKQINPDTDIEFVDSSPIVNAFTWKASNGRNNIEIHGGLARHIGIDWQAIAYIVGRQIAIVKGGPPYYDNNTREYSCEDVADYMGFVFARSAFPDPNGPMAFSGAVYHGGIAQLTAFYESLPIKGSVIQVPCALPKQATDTACRISLAQGGYNLHAMSNCWYDPTAAPTDSHSEKDEL